MTAKEVLIRNHLFWGIEGPEFHTFCQTPNTEAAGYGITAHSEVVKSIHDWVISIIEGYCICRCLDCGHH